MHSLKILSFGLVTPGGVGIDSLNIPWEATLISSLSGKYTHSPIYLVNQEIEQLVRWKKEPRLRRASPIVYFMLEAAKQAIDFYPSINRSKLGVIALSSFGSISYSIKFYNEFIKDGRYFASPILFPETVLNTPLSHLVSTLKISGPTYTQIGNKANWISGLQTAECWLKLNKVSHVLLVGGEEFHPSQIDAFYLPKLLDKGLSEGSGAILLSKQNFKYPEISIQRMHEITFFSKKQASQTINNFFQSFPKDIAILQTATGWMKKIESEITQNKFLIKNHLFYEASMAGVFWNIIQAMELIQRHKFDEIIVPIWGLSCNFSVLKIKKNNF